MNILKFGGTSVGTPQAIETIIQLTHEAKETRPVAVVVSAFAGATDKLIEMSTRAAEGELSYKKLFSEFEDRHLSAVHDLIPIRHQSSALAIVKMMLNELDDILHGTYLVGEYTNRTLDFMMSFGERLSAFIISEAFKAKQIDADYCDARDLVKTDNRFGTAGLLQEITYQSIESYFSNRNAIQIITGFIGSTLKGETTTLGRGGSDYTAAIFGAALSVNEIQIWTDVDGFMTADPRKVRDAFSIPQMSYKEALEMSNSGAKVLYPPTVQPAMLKNIPIRILNTFNPRFEGTMISSNAPQRKVSVCGISSLDDVALLRVEGSGLVRAIGTAKRVFSILAECNINIIFISQASSEHSICFAVSINDAESAKEAVEREFNFELSTGKIYPIAIQKNLSIVAVVGENMKHRTGVSGWFFQTLGKNGINVVAIAQGSSEINISVVIERIDEEKSLNALHDVFFLSERKTIHVFLVGTGLIGGTLLHQLAQEASSLKEQRALDIKVIGIARSTKMVFHREGISLNTWRKILEQEGEPTDIRELVNRMKSFNLSGSVFIDCTAADEIVGFYDEILSSSISVVTPNKRANSGKYEDYLKLKSSAIQHDVKFLYETNVGAGLPVINTLNDLLLSGDKILRIEAILSGSLSFIFNNFIGDRRFSDVVREARSLGYTEPDPRDDLSGTDVARKILILARETGLSIELSDVQVENFLPLECIQAPSVNEFFVELEKANPMFEEKKQLAHKNQQVLRFIASFEDGVASVNLTAVGRDHPFYNLSGSDNIVSYTTERYKERPLVVKGPGAGAEVTAAGVFANLISISNHLF